MNNSIRFYLVEAKCGHVGRNKYVKVIFAIMANSGKEAAEICRRLPRVKHDHKDAILSCREVSREEYLVQRDLNKKDAYLNVTNKQDQRRYCVNLASKVQDEEVYNDYINEIENTSPRPRYNRTKSRLNRSEILAHVDDEEYEYYR